MYKDPSQPVEKRVEDLLSQMTLEEKVAQLGSYWSFELLRPEGPDPEQLNTVLRNGIGQISRVAGMGTKPAEETAALVNAFQQFLTQQTRLGIPAIIHEECLAGYQAKQGTVFPQMIGAAATWEPDLVEKMATIIKHQMVAVGARQGLSPVLDVTRDPRWGRVEETFGEDPYLVSRMGSAYVKGLQGDDWKEGVIATAKHFLGYGNSEGGMNWAPAHIPQRELYEVFARPFEAAIREAGLASVMAAYNELDGVPCAVSKEVLTDLLRGQLGFEGFVVADYMAIEAALRYHHISTDLQAAGVQAFRAGLDLELPTIAGYGSLLVDAVQKGLVDIDTIDTSVHRVLEAKFKLGLFERPYVDVNKIPQVFNRPKNKETSRQMAAKSMTLLKNDGNLLPLKKDLKSIAVIGPNADSIRNLLGDYTYVAQIEGIVGVMQAGAEALQLEMDAEKMARVAEYFLAAFKDVFQAEHEEELARKNYDMLSILQSIRSVVSEETVATYAKGCSIRGDARDGFEEAVAAAQQAEVAILVLGGKSGLDETATSGETRDRASLQLSGVQQELLEAVYATGTPVVLVLVNGRPLSVTWAAEHVPAILEAWVPGEEGGPAVADVLFGNTVPGGKLPISVPRNVGQVPVYHYHKPSGGRSQLYGDYVDLSTKPLYPFGFGLSFTQFKYSNLRLSNSRVDSKGAIEISCDVSNVGAVAGDEVVQLYLHDREATITRPVQELAGFSRISLKPGDTCTLTFTVKMKQLGFYNRDMEFVVEPGKVDVMVGSSSADIRLKGEFEITGDVVNVKESRSFTSEVKHYAHG